MCVQYLLTVDTAEVQFLQGLHSDKTNQKVWVKIQKNTIQQKLFSFWHISVSWHRACIVGTIFTDIIRLVNEYLRPVILWLVGSSTQAASLAVNQQSCGCC